MNKDGRQHVILVVRATQNLLTYFLLLNADVCLVNAALAVKETKLFVCVSVNSIYIVLFAEKYLQFGDNIVLQCGDDDSFTN